MSILIDSHVHIYPHYDAHTLLSAFHTRIRAAAATHGVLMLAERQGTDLFSTWLNGQPPTGFQAIHSDATAIILRHPNQPDIIVIAGRQIACAERIEILALATRVTFRDGTPALQTLTQVDASGAIPVLAWGVGKWLFKRAHTITTILNARKGQILYIGDPSLRPTFWPTPILMAKAIADGHRVLAGSDPLPPKREETRAGQYADLATDATLDLHRPLTPQIVTHLSTALLTHTGHRSPPHEFLRRMFGR